MKSRQGPHDITEAHNPWNKSSSLKELKAIHWRFDSHQLTEHRHGRSTKIFEKIMTLDYKHGLQARRKAHPRIFHMHLKTDKAGISLRSTITLASARNPKSECE